jgi:demethylmenaquinone methyltransferase/2-methoxy-6-polyprenyl-1,4-benzoquinol methylase
MLRSTQPYSKSSAARGFARLLPVFSRSEQEETVMLNLLAGSTWPYPRSTVDPLVARYNAVAYQWHITIRRLGYLRAYRDLLRSLATQQLLPAGGCVVDCGIGSGGFSLALLQTTRATWRVEGVDISAAMLRVAKTNLTPFTQVTTDASRIDAMTFHCTDARRLPQADQVADLVISAHMLEHLADPVAALREMHRVLKPGAPALIVLTRKGIGRKLRICGTCQIHER